MVHRHVSQCTQLIETKLVVFVLILTVTMAWFLHLLGGTAGVAHGSLTVVVEAVS